MKQRIIKFNSLTLGVGVILFLIHQFLIQSYDLKLSFSLISIYLFFVISAIIIITGLELLFKFSPATTGYAFLVSVFLKMGLFTLIFFAGGLAEASLGKADKISILLPLFTFMTIETLVVVSRLKGVLTLGKELDESKK